MSAADVRHGPLEEVHRSLGAKLGPFAGWSMPIEYEGTLSEHRAVRERVGLFDLSHLGKLDVAGPGAFDVLQRLLTNDLGRIAVGRAQYHHVLNEQGGVEEDLFVYRLGQERWFVVPNAANTAKVAAAIRGGGAEVVEHEWCFLGVQGPRSPEVVGSLWAHAPELPFRGCITTAWDGTEVVLSRTGYTGERGYEVFADAAIAGDLWAAITEAGRAFDLRPCGLGARDLLRLEMGYPLYGQDLLPDRTSLEAGLDWAVSFEKGSFAGRDALLRQREQGLPSRLHGVVTADRRSIPRAHQDVVAHGGVAGSVTSGTFSPTLGRGIALAYLSPADAFAPGDQVEVDIRGRHAAGRITQTPFVERSPR